MPRHERLDGDEIRQLQFDENAVVEFEPGLPSRLQHGQAAVAPGNGLLDDALQSLERLVRLTAGPLEALIR